MQVNLHFLAGLAFALLPGTSFAACGQVPEPCRINSGGITGTYNLTLPEGPAPEGGWPAMIFLHGWGGQGNSVMNNDAITATVTARGYAMIAPDGTERPGRPGRGWRFHPDQRNSGGRNEVTFIGAVADDAAEKFGLNRDRMLLAGFSLGGSMTSYVACESPGSFAAYAPVAGSFWEKLPVSCAGPVQLLHTHGWTDNVVPLEGRMIRPEFVQGDVFASMAIWRSTNQCATRNPNGFERKAGMMIRNWQDCAADSSISFALHPGGHTVPRGWADFALNWFETLR